MSIVEPSKIPVPFADSGLKNAIPQTANNTTGKAGFDKGFPERTMLPKASGGIPPSGMDFNGILYDITSAIRYMQAGGRPTYDAAFAAAIGGYPSGAVLIGDDGVSVFQNAVAGNETNPNTGGDGWARPDLQVMELYRRSYAEAGHNLVDGSFEAGGTLVNANDVLLQERTGKAFSGPAGVVAAGTNPASGGFVDKSGALLNVNLLAGALQMRDSRFALRDVVSVADFDAPDDTQRFAKAINYLITNYGGGGLLVPPKVWNATVDVPSNITLIGFGEKSVIKGVNTGTNSYTVKLSNAQVGADPIAGGYAPIKSTQISNLKINANGADFGLYAAYCLFTDFNGVVVSGAKVRNLFMGAVFSFSVDKIMLSDGQDVGGSIAENLFGWAGDNYVCNAGNCRRIICYGNGLNGNYNKTTAPKSGAGIIVGKVISVEFDTFQGEQNKGVGAWVLPSSQAVFRGMYLENNANDGTADRWQVVNEAGSATFYDVQPHFLATDVFHALADTVIFNYLGLRITGPGYVSLHGNFSNVTVENPRVHTIKLSEATAVDSAGAPTRHNILRPSYRSSEFGSKTGVYEMGVYITLRSAQTISSGKTIIVRPVSLTPTLQTLNVPAGTYADGDTIYMKFLHYNAVLEGLSAVNIGYGAGWAGIGLIDIGVYIKLMV